MPCHSASNVRFASAETQLQQKCQELRARAQTAAYRAPNIAHCRSYSPQRGYMCFRRHNEQQMAYDQKQLRRNERDRKRNQAAAKQLLLRPSDVQRLQQQGKLVSIAEQTQALEADEQEHQRQLQLAEQTRQHFKQIDAARQSALGEDPLKVEMQLENASLLTRAFLAKQEQEEEVKQINRMILDAKCKAVREAQIQEKQQMARALREDDERLAKMVNDRALQALSVEDERERKELEKRAKYAQEIRQQLIERENVRLLEAKRVEHEAKSLRKASELLQADEQRQREFVQLRKQRFREELQRIRDMSNVFKQMLSEQERLAELRIVAYMREKREKEQQLLELKNLHKKNFEQKQQRIYTAAAEAMKTRQANDELQYLRERDRKEREYRQREKAAAVQKREVERDLLEARSKQTQEMRTRLALEIGHAEQQFNKLMERMRVEEAQQKQLDKQREAQRLSYRQELKQQMTDKQEQRERLADMERTRMDQWLLQEQQREVNIKHVIESKIAAMRENCLPEKYLKEVEKKLKHIQASRQRIR